MKKTLIGAAIVAAIAFTGAANAQSTASATLTGPGAATMSVDTFRSNPPCCAGFGRSQVVTVGATLHVAANQAQGNYLGTATFIVTRP